MNRLAHVMLKEKWPVSKTDPQNLQNLWKLGVPPKPDQQQVQNPLKSSFNSAFSLFHTSQDILSDL